MRRTFEGAYKALLGVALGCALALGACPVVGIADEVVVEPEGTEETTVVVQGEEPAPGSVEDVELTTQTIVNDVSYLYYASEADAISGKTSSGSAANCTKVEQSTTNWVADTWYVVDEDVTIDGHIDCYGTVHLILCDGKTLTVNKADASGISIANGGCLTIYAQSEGEQRGSLAVNVTGNDQAAFFVNNGAQITINGGTVKAAGTGDGIYAHGPNGTCAVTINGGRVDASANGTTKSSYGIYSDGSITINGGEVTASANNTGAHEAIGIYGNPTYVGTVTINGGKVTASANCAGTGSACGISGKTITVNNGLTVMAGDAAPGTDVTSTFATDHTQNWVHIQKVIPVDSVSLNKTSATLTVGDTEALTVTVNPEDATNKTVTWKSSNEHVATVDENGMVTAVGAGTATITATSNADNTKSASCTVTVKAKPEPKPEPEPEPVVIPDASVTAHVQRVGWMAPVADGTAAGTTGKSRRMEALTLKLPDGVAGGIEYRGHVQRSGWEKGWKADGATSGTTGKSRRMEAVQIRLTGEAEKTYDVYYRVHSQRYGWMAWAKNGEEAGTTGMSRRAEAIQVVLVKKDAPAPDATYKGVTQTYAKPFVKK